MIVNAGFEKKVKEPGSKKAKFIYKNVQWIRIPNNLLPTQIRSWIMDFAPEGEGWTLIGFAIIDRVRE